MSDSEDPVEKESFPQTYIVIECNKKIRADTAQWIADIITKERRKCGVELLLRRQPPSTCKSLTLHVSVDPQRLLELAKEMDVRERDKDTVVPELTVDQPKEFVEPKFSSELLTTAEKQMLVRHELENIRALKDLKHIEGYPEYSLNEGQSILSACLHHGIIKQMYPLHDTDEISKLETYWYTIFPATQHYDEIRQYFGESIASYFLFLGLYTRVLTLPVALGFLQMFMPSKFLPVLCLFNIICSSLFLKLWSRKCSELAKTWGNTRMANFDELPHPHFQKGVGTDDVHSKRKPQSSSFSTYFKVYLVSLPLVLLCMVGAFGAMLASFWFDEYFGLSIWDLPFWWRDYLPIVYAFFIPLINGAYRKFANFLTEWENHPTQSQFEKHRVTKLVLFEFVNNFMSLFYIAFYERNIALLRHQLALQLIVHQVVNNFDEVALPWLLLRFEDDREVSASINLMGVKDLNTKDPRISQAKKERKMKVYDDLYDDYLELFLQFGYVFFFSAAYPLAAFWAYVNNFIEIRIDALKLCKISQRPFLRKVKDTGAWQLYFRVLCALSIITNCALLAFSSDLNKSLIPDLGSTDEWLMPIVLFALTHRSLGQIIHYTIPRLHGWTREALVQINNNAKQAFKLLIHAFRDTLNVRYMDPRVLRILGINVLLTSLVS